MLVYVTIIRFEIIVSKWIHLAAGTGVYVCVCIIVCVWTLTSAAVSVPVADLQCSGVSMWHCGGSLS